jgi:hypothetical protein
MAVFLNFLWASTCQSCKKKILKTSVRPIFMKMCVFWAKHKIFMLAVEDFPTIQFFFLSSKVLEGLKYAKKKATKRISKNVVFQATLLATPVHLLYGMPHPRSLKCSLNFALTLEYSFIHNLVSFDMTYSEYARKLQLRKILY